MKRYASHYLLLPGVGYLKQYVLEIEEVYVIRIFPLSEEVENTEWLPGVIVLLTESDQVTEYSLWKEEYSTVRAEELTALLSSQVLRQSYLIPYLFFPFDFTMMQPVAETRHRLLR